MAAVSPSSDPVPSGVPPPVASTTPPPVASTTPPPVASTTSPPLASTTPPPLESTTPPPVASTTPPQPSTTPPPVPSIPIVQPEANPPESSNPPPPDAVPPSNSGTPVTPPPVESAPPPTPSAPPPTPPVSPPTVPVTPDTPPPVASPPPVPSASPPPQISSPPPVNAPPPTPPVGAPPAPILPPPPQSSPPPPTSTPPPTSSPTPPSSNPPTASPPPPPLSPNPPVGSPPPPSSEPPKTSPSPPTSPPPEESPTPPALQPPRASPSRPAASPPKDSPPSSGGSPPPSDPGSAPPPSVIPGTPAPVVPSPPSSSVSPPDTTVPSSPSLPGNESGSVPQSSDNAPSKGGIGSGGGIAIAVVSAALILGLIGLLAVWMFKRKKRSSGANGGHIIPSSMGSSPRSDAKLLVKSNYPTSYFGGGSGTATPSDHGGFGQSRSWFTYQELSQATGGFSDANLLGEGGFGCVYKGHLADGRVVAVKQLKIGGGQGEREFRAEVEIISRIHHRHLVSLVGYCIAESKRLLVYDYVPNNTLHFHLHGEGRPVMDWATRVRIAVGAARGITYLHEDCHPRIIHRDIKSSNILIDNNYEAQVADFGLAKLAMDADTHISTRVMGTFGYMAPEYATTGKLTEKSDVYSFGVVLLELITGRKPVDESQPLGDESLVEWARPLLIRALDMGEFEGLVDPRLEKNYIVSEMFRMTEAAAACVRHSSSKRPRMGQVARAFSVSDSGDLSNGLKVGESQLYNSAQQSAEIRWFRRMAFGSQDTSSDVFSQPSQNLGFSTDSRQNIYHSAQPVQDGNSRQQSPESERQSSSGQHGVNVSFSDEHRREDNIPRQPNWTAPPSTYQRNQNVDFINQGGRSLNLHREDSLNR